MNRIYIASLALVLAAAAAGCPEKGDQPDPDPAQQCDNFVSNLCWSLNRCSKSSNPNFFKNCVDSWNTQRDCNDYNAPNETHQECMSQLNNISCTVLVQGDKLNLPAACNKVIDAWLD